MRTAIAVTTLMLTAAGTTLPAQDAPPPPRTQLTLDLGFVDASGNSDLMNLNVGEKLTWRPGRVIFSQTAKVLYGETEGSRTTESYDLGLRGEYKLAARIGGFAFVAFQRDPFAGLASRLSAGPGIAIGIIQSARDTLGLDVAITTQKERGTAAAERSFAATRTGLAFKHLLAAAAFFTQSFEWTANLDTMDDMRLNSETALTAPLSKQIALRSSYLIRFDNLPEPGFERTDRILTTGVQIAF